jgi:GNAT superfamily N-acetyltransferase
VRKWLWSEAAAVALRRDLATPLTARRPILPLIVRPVALSDVPALVDTDGNGIDGAGALLRVGAAHLLESGLDTCYVAVTEAGDPCYMQYLVLPTENAKLEDVFGGLIPPLEADEALIEFAFTLEKYRAQGIMPHALSSVAAKARESGARWLVTYVYASEPLLLRFYTRNGFMPFRVRRERYRFLRRRVSFDRLPADASLSDALAAAGVSPQPARGR